SPAEMAINMKAQVHELLSRGYTEEQILKYFELSYGQFVLLRPKFEGVNRLVWLLPVGALVLGAAVVFFKLRKLEAGAPSRSSEAQTQPAATDDPYLTRVRDLVSGDKSGTRCRIRQSIGSAPSQSSPPASCSVRCSFTSTSDSRCRLSVAKPTSSATISKRSATRSC